MEKIKGKIFPFFVGLLLGAIISSGSLLIYNKTHKKEDTKPNMNFEEMKDRPMDFPSGEIPEKPDGEPPEKPNGEMPEMKSNDNNNQRNNQKPNDSKEKPSDAPNMNQKQDNNKSGKMQSV